MPQNQLSRPFNVPSRKVEELVDEIGKMPIGSLIGNVLASCVDAQTHAAQTAWAYTQKVLENKTPIVFIYQDEEGLKSLSVPLFTIVPLPYLRLDNIDIDFDAEVSFNTEKSKEFLVTVNNEVSQEKGVNVAKGASNLHIGVSAGTTDMPAGLSILLQHIGSGLIVEDVTNDETKAALGSLLFSLTKDKEEEELRRLERSYFTSTTGSIDNPADYSGAPLTGVQVLWTKALKATSGTAEYSMSQVDLLATVTSALLWRKFNGPVKLYTDTSGLEYLQRLKLTNLWNGGIDSQLLDRIPNSFDPAIFPGAGRLFAIQAETAPFVVFDNDLLVWQPLRPLIGESYIMTLHPEPLARYQQYYPEQNLLKKPAGWSAPSGWDWTVDPVNTAITFYGEEGLKNYYVQQALRFMGGQYPADINIERPADTDSQMRFVDRRMFAMCMKAMTSAASTFLTSDTDEGKPFSHIWGANPTARNNADINRQLCAELTKILQTHFSDIPMPSLN